MRGTAAVALVHPVALTQTRCRSLILELVTQLSIATNLGLICFTSTILDSRPWSHKILGFLLVEVCALPPPSQMGAAPDARAPPQHILLALRYVLTLVDDVPADVAVQMERQARPVPATPSRRPRPPLTPRDTPHAQDSVVRRVLNIVKGIPADDDDEDEAEATHGTKGSLSPQRQAFRASDYPSEWFSLLSTSVAVPLSPRRAPVTPPSPRRDW